MTEQKSLKVDLRGLNCPEPVIRTKKLLDNKELRQIEALVDDEVCVSNLKRLAGSQKVSFSSQARNGFFACTLSRDGGAEMQAPNPSIDNLKTEAMTVVFLTKNYLGEGDPEFSGTLLNIFLQTLLESGHRPRAILLANSGVKLLGKDSATAKVLNDFREQGTEVLACGLCVEFYKLKEQINTEQITNMFAICEYLSAASKVIQP